MGWQQRPLCDIIQFKNGKKRPASEGAIPVYGGNGILGYTNTSNYNQCVIIGRVGAYCGSVYYEENACWVSDNAIAAQPKGETDILFVYYLLKSLNLNGRHIGTSQPLLTQEILNRIECKIPPLQEQRQIASVLFTLDNKITANRKISDNLQKQAYTYFIYLFVENMISTWHIGTISDLGTVVGGGTPSKTKSEYYAEDGIAWITPKDLSLDKSKFISHGENDISELGYQNSSATLMPAGTVLFSSRAPIGYIAIARNEVTTNQGFKSIVPHPDIGTPYVYFFLLHNLPLIESKASGSTFKEVSGSVMKSVEAVIPDATTLAKFNDFCYPLFEMQAKLEQENRQLVEIRDSLLPRLMGGKIDVSSIQL